MFNRPVAHEIPDSPTDRAMVTVFLLPERRILLGFAGGEGGWLVVVSIRDALKRIAAFGQEPQQNSDKKFGAFHEIYLRIEASGLFDPEVYLDLQEDVRDARGDPWWHFLRHGLREGRHFTSSESVVRALAQVQHHFDHAREAFLQAATEAQAETDRPGAKLRREKIKIAVYCNSQGNFYMREIADLLCLGLQRCGIDAVHRDEKASREEKFGIRVFVAPHEFFFLGDGMSWQKFAVRSDTVLYNVEQLQTPWFCRALSLLLDAPLILDINLQTAQILEKTACNAVFFMPGYLEETRYTLPQLGISNIQLLKGYRFSKEVYNWQERDALADRPIDVLFTGARTPYRDKSLVRLDSIAEECRFICVYRDAIRPFIATDPIGAASETNWALSQRAKIVLNLHRDWIGYFEWSRMVLRGMWQGTCVVTDRGLPNPVFEAGVHYLEESPRHLGELIRWLLLTEDGRSMLDSTRRAGYQRAKTLGAMPVALAPVLDAFERLLRL